MRDSLMAALMACAHTRPSRSRTRKFLDGLSSDEMQFIAGYLGSRILGSEGKHLLPQTAVRGHDVTESAGGIRAAIAQDQQHKMILLREFLGFTGIQAAARPARFFRWN